MALGVLLILFIVFIITAVIIQILLYKSKNKSKNTIYIINMLFALIMSYLAFTSLPTNYTEQRVLATVWGVISILALIIKLSKEKFIVVSKIMLTIAILGSLVQLFS